MVDAGKTMRPACLKSLPKLGISSIDALLLTHDHADAIFGLDDDLPGACWSLRRCGALSLQATRTMSGSS